MNIAWEKLGCLHYWACQALNQERISNIPKFHYAATLLLLFCHSPLSLSLYCFKGVDSYLGSLSLLVLHSRGSEATKTYSEINHLNVKLTNVCDTCTLLHIYIHVK